MPLLRIVSICAALIVDVCGVGMCAGNDSRCPGSAKVQCSRLKRQGSDCRWKGTDYVDIDGTCIGNDSRCSSSSQSRCDDLEHEGADCQWDGTEDHHASTGPSGGPSDGPWDDGNMVESPPTKVKIVVTGDLIFADLALDTEDKIAVFEAAVKGTMASSLEIRNDWISVEMVSGRRLSLKPSTSVIAKYKVEIPKGTPTLLTGTDLVDQIGELKYNAAKKNEFVDVLNVALAGSGIATLEAAKIAVTDPVAAATPTPISTATPTSAPTVRPVVPASSSTQNNGTEGGHRSTASTSERLGSSLAVLSVIALAIS